MGRAGIEPATLGLKVDAIPAGTLGASGRTASLSRFDSCGLGWAGVGLVDLLLTHSVALRGNTNAQRYRVQSRARRACHLTETTAGLDCASRQPLSILLLTSSQFAVTKPASSSSSSPPGKPISHRTPMTRPTRATPPRTMSHICSRWYRCASATLVGIVKSTRDSGAAPSPGKVYGSNAIISGHSSAKRVPEIWLLPLCVPILPVCVHVCE